ncbi:hypothetical protein AMATHDRAFT_8097 [Amanita thiersii Skay4041]|uniref:Uncharacterized protein n=1 Tax=Amanita thiersii Skay4041 TaxID=703135 RepID=A0A2A9ND59_9AGAR|nr:hypothetical protein AMATHDRAFT_8097 [Amanita thiersii Skay4041]
MSSVVIKLPNILNNLDHQRLRLNYLEDTTPSNQIHLATEGRKICLDCSQL